MNGSGKTAVIILYPPLAAVLPPLLLKKEWFFQKTKPHTKDLKKSIFQYLDKSIKKIKPNSVFMWFCFLKKPNY